MKNIIITERGKDLGWDEDLLRGVYSLGEEFLLTSESPYRSELTKILAGLMVLTGEGPFWLSWCLGIAESKKGHYPYHFGDMEEDSIFKYNDAASCGSNYMEGITSFGFVAGGIDGFCLRELMESVTYPANKECSEI